MDLVSILPVEIIDNDKEILKLLKISRLFRLRKLLKNFNFKHHITEILMNFFMLLMILHWFTCLFLYTVRYSTSDDFSERNKYNSWFPSNYHIITSSSTLD